MTSLHDCFQHYVDEKIAPNARRPKAACARVNQAARNIYATWGKERDPTTLRRSDSREYRRRRLAQGVCDATVRRELAICAAAVRHAVREERLEKAPQFEIPPGSAPRVRFLTREEKRQLMAAPMSARLRRFWRLAFGTGARAEAIEELTWSRVDMVNRLIDFRMPGVNHKNKRRVVVPISDELFRQLQVMHETREDDYVIGLGPRGRVTSTYHHAKALLRAIGIDEKGIARHVARHTFVSWRVQAGVPIAHVAELIGDRPTMVEKVYGHLQPKHLVVAANEPRDVTTKQCCPTCGRPFLSEAA